MIHLFELIIKCFDNIPSLPHNFKLKTIFIGKKERKKAEISLLPLHDALSKFNCNLLMIKTFHQIRKIKETEFIIFLILSPSFMFFPVLSRRDTEVFSEGFGKMVPVGKTALLCDVVNRQSSVTQKRRSMGHAEHQQILPG